MLLVVSCLINLISCLINLELIVMYSFQRTFIYN